MHRITFVFALTAYLISSDTALPAAERSATDLLPRTTVLYAEFLHPPQIISHIFDHPLREKIEALEAYKAATQTSGYQRFHAGRKFAEITLGMEWREALDALTARGIFVGVDAATEGLAILIHAKDVESLELFRTKLLEITKLGKNPDQIKEGDYRGVTAYEVNKSKFAVVDDWLLITNKAETGKAVLDRFLDGEGDSLADNETFKAARETQPRNGSGWGYVELKTLRDAGVAEKLFTGRAENPAAELLIGGVLCSLQKTPFATAELDTSLKGIEFNLTIPHKKEWVTEEREYFFGTDGDGHGPALPETGRTLFTLSTFRDVSEMWLRAGDLFNERINDGFAEADANLTTFFSGKDFGEDILGALTPHIGFVASSQDFSDVLPVPAIKLPQFALVLEMKEPKTMTRELRRTFQSLIGFINVTGAMEGRPQLELDMDKMDNGAEVVTSTYIPEVDDEDSTQADILFNFSPSVGFANERFVVASTDRLARELVMAEVPVKNPGAANTAANLNAEVLVNVLDDNREQLISQNMLEEGNSRDEAEAAISLLLNVVGYFEDLTLDLTNDDGRLAVEFAVRVKE